jgi:hypothetical protein
MFRKLLYSLKPVNGRHFHPSTIQSVKYSRTFSSANPAAQDDPALWVRSIVPDVDVLKGVSVQEYVFENVGKWENHTAFVRNLESCQKP